MINAVLTAACFARTPTQEKFEGGIVDMEVNSHIICTIYTYHASVL